MPRNSSADPWLDPAARAALRQILIDLHPLVYQDIHFSPVLSYCPFGAESLFLTLLLSGKKSKAARNIGGHALFRNGAWRKKNLPKEISPSGSRTLLNCGSKSSARVTGEYTNRYTKRDELMTSGTCASNLYLFSQKKFSSFVPSSSALSAAAGSSKPRAATENSCRF